MAEPVLKLTDPHSLRAYAHPLRLSLIGLLRRRGPLTATQAAAELGESVPNCSFHLRQLARYGFAERAPGADARERPWRATAQMTSWDDDSDDPEMRAATDQLNSVLLSQFFARAETYLARRHDEPTDWRAAAGFGDQMLYVTAQELREVTEELDAVLTRFGERATDPSKRPAGHREVQIVQLAIPIGPVPPTTGREPDRD